MQQLVFAMLLDDGGPGIARALAGLAVVVVLGLFVAVLVPIAVLAEAGVLPIARAPAAGPARAPAALASQPPLTGRPTLVGAQAVAGTATIDVARQYLGVQYVFGGTDPTTGLDCSGLVQLVFRQLGLSLPRTAQLQYAATVRVTQDQLQ